MTYEISDNARPVSEESKTLDRVIKHFDHEIEHVISFPIIIKKFDKDCATCQILFDRIDKKSQNPTPATLDGKPVAIVQHTTILCAIGMHDECGKDYVMPKVKITSSCICECHQKPKPVEEMKGQKQKRKRSRKLSAH